MASTKRNPIGRSATTIGMRPWCTKRPRGPRVKSKSTGSGAPNGITANSSSAGMNDIAGASRKSHRFASAGKVSSLRMFLSPSAAGCSRPAGPNPVGAAAVLHPGAHLSLHQGQQCHAHHDHREHHQHLDDAEQQKPLHLRGHDTPDPRARAGHRRPRRIGEHPSGEPDVVVGGAGENRPALAQELERLSRGGRGGRARARAGDDFAGHPPGRPGHAWLRLGLVVALDPAIAIHVGAVLLRHGRNRKDQLGVPEPLSEDRPQDAPRWPATFAIRARSDCEQVGVQHDHQACARHLQQTRGPIGPVSQ